LKISHISIKGFLALSHLELNLQAPIDVFCGANEAGKSSLRDAIQWGLTGCARGLKTHEQQALLIAHGHKAAEVTLTFDNGSKLTRRKTLKSPPTLEGTLPDDLGLVTALCDSHHFLALPEKDRRAELFRLIPGLQPTAEEIAVRLFKAAEGEPDSVPFRKITLDLGQIATSRSFKAAEDEAITRRREAKRVVKELQAQEPEQKAAIGEREYILPDIQIQQVEEGLAKLYAERDKLLKRQGKAEGELDKLPGLEAELASLIIPDPPEEGELQEWQEALDINRPILEKLRAAVAGLEQGRPARKFPALCPACEVGCPSSGKEAVPAVPSANPAQAENLKAQLQEQVQQVERLEAGLKSVQDQVVEYNRGIKGKVILEERIEALQNQQVQVEETAKLQTDIDALASRIALGEELRDRVREFWRKQKEADAVMERVGQAEKEAALYDTLAKALAPNGIPSALIAETLGPINGLLGKAAAHLFPGRLLTLTEDLEIVLQGQPYVTLSKSARLRVGIAFQYALAKLSGARLLMVDEADQLDSPNRAALINFLLEIQPDFDNILIFSTTDHACPSPIPEMQIWVMQAGKVTPLNPGFEYQDGAMVKVKEAA
jgi:hypothetical protein